MLDLNNPATIKNILSKYHLAPNKFLGQNFLIDQNVLDKIIETADLKPGNNVLEIGPGLGTLTAALCRAGANIVAIEKDKDLIPVLKDNLKEYKNYKIINNDFLQIDFDKAKTLLLGNGVSKLDLETPFPSERSHTPINYKIISNIPYYITSPVIRKIFSFFVLPTEIIFLVQREVAERICAPAGDMSLISLYVQFHGTPSVEGIVKPESFWPAPKVESAIVKIIIGKRFELPTAEEDALWRLAKIGFSSRRKTLANNLAAGFRRKNSEIKELLKKAGFSENIRAQELSVEKWIKLLKVMERLK